MYLAGIHIPITETQALNALSWASTIIWFRACLPNAKFRASADKEAGPIKAMPPGKQGQMVSVVHGLGLFLPMGAFVLSLPLAKFGDPGWLAKTSLPSLESHELYVGLRIAGCVGAFAGAAIGKLLYKHLGHQWAAIGVSQYLMLSVVSDTDSRTQVRERPKLVKTGPYAVVRHPGYR